MPMRTRYLFSLHFLREIDSTNGSEREWRGKKRLNKINATFDGLQSFQFTVTIKINDTVNSLLASVCAVRCARVYVCTRLIWSLENHLCNFCCRIRYVCIIYFDWKFDWFVPMCLGLACCVCAFGFMSELMLNTCPIALQQQQQHYHRVERYAFSSASMLCRWKPTMSDYERFKHKIGKTIDEF